MIIDQCNISNAGLRVHRHHQRRGLTNVSCVIRYLYRQRIATVRPVSIWRKAPLSSNLG